MLYCSNEWQQARNCSRPDLEPDPILRVGRVVEILGWISWPVPVAAWCRFPSGSRFPECNSNHWYSVLLWLQRKAFDPSIRPLSSIKLNFVCCVEKGRSDITMEYKRRFMAREAVLSTSSNNSPAKCPARDLRIDMIHSTGNQENHRVWYRNSSSGKFIDKILKTFKLIDQCHRRLCGSGSS